MFLPLHHVPAGCRSSSGIAVFWRIKYFPATANPKAEPADLEGSVNKNTFVTGVFICSIIILIWQSLETLSKCLYCSEEINHVY